MSLVIPHRFTFTLGEDGVIKFRDPRTNVELGLSSAVMSLLSSIGGGQSPAEWAEENGVEIEALAASLDVLRGAGLLVEEDHRARVAERAAKLPIFAVGCHRSGTTLLRYLLDAHPNIACPGETKYVLGLESFLEHPMVWQSLMSLGMEAREIHGEVRKLIESVMGQYATRRNKPRWADKTPNYFRILDFIDEVFRGEVLFVFIVRHPHSCVQSLYDSFPQHGNNDPDIQAANMRHGRSRRGYAQYWADVNHRIDLFRTAHPERCHVLRYDDLVTKPEEILSAMFTFLGEPFPKELMKEAFTMRHDSGLGDRRIEDTDSIRSDWVKRWEGWAPGEIAAVTRIVEPVARRFGFELPT